MLKDLVNKLAVLLNEIKGRKEELETIKAQILQIMKEEDVNPLVSKESKIVLSREIKTKVIYNYPLIIDMLFQEAQKHNREFDTKQLMKFDNDKIKEFVKKIPELKKAVKSETGNEYLVIRELKEEK